MSEMKPWRPEEGWNPSEIRQRVLIMCAELYPSADCQIKLIEAGADAMLEARRELDARICERLRSISLRRKEEGWHEGLDHLIDPLQAILGEQ